MIQLFKLNLHQKSNTMKKVLIASILLSGLISLNSCKKSESTVETKTTETIVPSGDSTTPKTEAGTASQAKTYEVIATPDMVLLGKDKEASVKIINLKAVELSDPDGKVTGIEMSYGLELTNKNSIAKGGYIQLDLAKFRLVLDNGSKISHDNYNSLSASADETKSVEGNTFKIPAGTKPVSLNLFYDETIVNVKLELK